MSPMIHHYLLINVVVILICTCLQSNGETYEEDILQEPQLLGGSTGYNKVAQVSRYAKRLVIIPLEEYNSESTDEDSSYSKRGMFKRLRGAEAARATLLGNKAGRKTQY